MDDIYRHFPLATSYFPEKSVAMDNFSEKALSPAEKRPLGRGIKQEREVAQSSYLAGSLFGKNYGKEWRL